MTSANSADQESMATSGGLTRIGNIIRTPGFEIVIDETRLTISSHDRREYTEIWSNTGFGLPGADPRTLRPRSLVFNLPDGARISVSMFKRHENGWPLIDDVAVAYRREIVLVRNVFVDPEARTPAASKDGTQRLRIDRQPIDRETSLGAEFLHATIALFTACLHAVGVRRSKYSTSDRAAAESRATTLRVAR